MAWISLSSSSTWSSRSATIICPGAEAAAVDDGFRIEVDEARFRAEDDELVFGHEVSTGAQAVAIQDRADETAIGEGHGGGAIPGLGAVSYIGEEGGAVEISGGLDEHADGFGDGAAVAGEQLDGFVEAGGVGAVLGEDGLELGREGRGAGVHARAVAPDGVDFAVVREHAQRLGAIPGGRDVGGVALVEEREGRGEGGVGEIRVEIGEEAAGAHGLVDHVGRGERTDIALGAAALKLLAGEEEPVREPLRVVCGDEDVADDRQRGQSDLAEDLGASGNVAPGEDGEILRGERLLDFCMRLGVAGGKEHYADGERLRCVERRAGGGEQEVARDGGGDADAVAGLAVGGYSAAVLEACEGSKCFLQNVMRRDVG